LGGGFGLLLFYYVSENQTPKEKYTSRSRVFENRVLRRIFGLMWQEAGGGCIMRSFITCTLHQRFLG
jgi:hypothetical protein